MRRTATKTASRKPAAKAAPTSRKAAPAKAPAAKGGAGGRDVTQYADKEPTDLHKTMARWIVTEVGYNPEDAASLREAFLMGVSIATAARPVFQSSEYLAAWYEESGTAKRGRGATESPAKGGRKAAKDEEPEEEEYEDTDTEDEESEEDDEGVDIEELEAELKALTIGALRKTAKDDYELSLKAGSTKQEIINAILDAVEAESEEEDGDDEEEGVDLEELQEELEGLSPADLKAAAKEYGVTPKRGERKAALIDRILQAVEEEAEEESEEDDEPEEEVEETPKRGRGAAKPAAKSSKEFLF